MTKRRHLPALAATAALATAACSDDESPGAGDDASRLAMDDFPRGETLYSTGTAWGPPGDFNPISAGQVTGLNGLGYEYLFLLDTAEQRLTPWLAESGQWTGGLEYELTLREGVSWSDGKRLTADDVAYTVELGKIDGVPYAAVWDWLEAVEVLDERSLRFTFSEARHQEWDNFLYTNEIVPKHVYEAYTPEELVSGTLDPDPVVSGPYAVHSYDETRVAWVRRDDWWATEALGLQVRPRFIVDLVTPGNADILNMLIEGRLDLANNFMPGVDDFLTGDPALTTYFDKPPFMAPFNVAMLVPNTTREPLDDPEFRRAVAFAISPGQIVDAVYGGMVTEAHPTGLLPVWERYYDAEAIGDDGFVFEPSQAVAILTEAGYTDEDGDGFVETREGEPFSLQLIVPDGWTDWEAAAQSLASDLVDAGIDCTAVFLDAAEVDAARESGDFDLVVNNNSRITNSPWSHFQNLFQLPVAEIQRNGNFSRWENEEAWELTQELSTLATDDPRYAEVITELELITVQDLPAIPVWYNGAWSQASNAVWTGWPTAERSPGVYPSFWNEMWGMGAVRMLADLRPAE
ncbi:peptide/nickel transport system substrate-binding protein [Glycomyces sambucus]|uniref:Peptide/nickel transport system substrate-binding protein n=1 Tax=Glycomyces sambucus TaxID=380244 RepID=A0A1G9HAF7_9ACTN|nr:ABC transporter substrate-binding protein [Glycomyces sambucus]SDL09869.1 peptide/nickel transport system substrate-binding protein [Glycomyces sambucus]